MVKKLKALDFPINSWVVFTKDLPELDIKKGTTGIVYSSYYKHKFLVKVNIQLGMYWWSSYWIPKDSIELRPEYIEKVKDDLKIRRKYAHLSVLCIANNIEEMKAYIDSDAPDDKFINNVINDCKSLIEKLEELNNKKRLTYNL